MWERVYHLQYFNNKKSYIQGLVSVINWKATRKRFSVGPEEFYAELIDITSKISVTRRSHLRFCQLASYTYGVLLRFSHLTQFSGTISLRVAISPSQSTFSTNTTNAISLPIQAL